MTPARPRLAICIPAYDAEGHLPALLADVRAQTVPFDEVLVYDDASTDGTARIAEAGGATVVRGTENRGCSFGKNVLAAAATSEWLHFCDADDRRLPELVEVARGWVEGPDPPDVVLLAFEDRDPAGRTLLVRRYDDDLLRTDALRAVLLEQHGNCGLYRREAFLRAGGFDTDPEVLHNEDDALHTRLALAGLRFRAENRVLAHILQRPGSMSRSRPVACLRSKYHVLRKASAAAPAAVRPAIGLRLWRCAGALGGYGDWTHAFACLRLARDLGVRDAPEGKAWFRWTSRVHPAGALVLREAAIRAFRPSLRRRPAGAP